MSSILPIWVALLKNQGGEVQKRGNKAQKIAKTLRNQAFLLKSALSGSCL